jgi:hypothetical protein
MPKGVTIKSVLYRTRIRSGLARVKDLVHTEAENGRLLFEAHWRTSRLVSSPSSAIICPNASSGTRERAWDASFGQKNRSLLQ